MVRNKTKDHYPDGVSIDMVPTGLNYDPRGVNGRWYFSGICPHTKKQITKTIGNSIDPFDLVLKRFDLFNQPKIRNEDWVSKLFWSTSKNAKSKGREMLLTKSDIRQLLDRADGFCEATGLPFSAIKEEGQRVRPWIPSIDRRNNNEGYSLENCRIIAASVNLCLNQFGEDFLRLIANRITYQRGKQ